MKISIFTAFPDLIRSYLGASVLGRGIAKGRLEVEVLDIRDFAEGSYRQIDDYSYGSGGMVLMAEPLQKALDSLKGNGKPFLVYPSPQGTRLHQELVEDLSRKEHLVILCGHYEGVDERFVEKNADLEISIGDFVLTGGEMPAMAIVDAVSRLIPGVVGKSEAVREDSFFGGMLDTPHYTRPTERNGHKVPEILLSGDEKAIKKWRRRQSVERTLKRRPDIVGRAGIMPWLSKGAYVMEVHYPVLDKRGEKSSTAITGMDLHDIARACRTYGIKKYLLVTPLAQQREMVKRIASHWTEGWGASYNQGSGHSHPHNICFCQHGAEMGRERKKQNFQDSHNRKSVEVLFMVSLKADTGRGPLPVFLSERRGLLEDFLKKLLVMTRCRRTGQLEPLSVEVR